VGEGGEVFGREAGLIQDAPHRLPVLSPQAATGRCCKLSDGETLMKAMVIGAGIGGLTMALSLHAAGIDVVVYENQSRTSRPSVSASISNQTPYANWSSSASVMHWREQQLRQQSCITTTSTGS
jgi:pyruvate/2-oxoglutarate dehydrogenase complex dihydrolipoamide dehydrogenase (E3) component